jgi:hypothetical protein
MQTWGLTEEPNVSKNGQKAFNNFEQAMCVPPIKFFVPRGLPSVVIAKLLDEVTGQFLIIKQEKEISD